MTEAWQGSAKTLTEDAAAFRLQRAWRLVFRPRTTARLVSRIEHVGLTEERMKQLSFEHLVCLLRDRRLIHACRRMFVRILLSKNRKRKGGKTKGVQWSAACFLKAYLVTLHSSYCMSVVGELEEALIGIGKDMLDIFHKIMAIAREFRSLHKVDRGLIKSFKAHTSMYMESYQAWEIFDKQRLVKQYMHVLLTLYQAESTVATTDQQKRMQFAARISETQERIKELGGEEELRAFEDMRANGAAEAAADVEAGADAEAGDAQGSNAGTSRAAHEYVKDRIQKTLLCHELLLDPQFQLQVDTFDSEEKLESEKRFYFESIVNEFASSPRVYICLFIALSRIRENLLRFCPGDASVIKATLNLPDITARAESGHHTWEEGVRLLVAVMGILLRNSSNKGTAEEWRSMHQTLTEAGEADRPQAFASALQFLEKCVAQIRIDAANKQLDAVRDIICQKGITHESQMFWDRLNAGHVRLDKAKAWLKQALAALAGTDAVDLRDMTSERIVQAVHNEAMLALIVGDDPLTPAVCAETLEFDIRHLIAFRKEFQCLATVATMIASARQHLMASDDVTDLDALAKITDTLEACQNAPDVETVRKIAVTLSETSQPVQQRLILWHMLEMSGSPDNLVRCVFGRGIRKFVLGILTATEPVEAALDELPRMYGALCLGSVLQLVPRIEKMAKKFKHLVQINAQVYVGHYGRLVREAAAEILQEAAETPAQEPASDDPDANEIRAEEQPSEI